MNDISRLLGFEYAHRGLFDKDKGIGENTLEAFENAVNQGYGMELDVQLTKDAQVVVAHDGDLKRLFHLDGEIKNLDYAQVAFLPTLSQVLTLVDGKTPIIVELKSYDRIYLLAEKVRALLAGYRGAYAIESFDFRIVRWFRKNAPEVIRGQLVESAVYLYRCGYSRPDFIAARLGMEGNGLFKAAKKWVTPHTVAWTARTREEMRIARECYTLQIFELTAIKD